MQEKHESKHEVTKVVYLVKDGGKFTKCIKSLFFIISKVMFYSIIVVSELSCNFKTSVTF